MEAPSTTSLFLHKNSTTNTQASRREPIAMTLVPTSSTFAPKNMAEITAKVQIIGTPNCLNTSVSRLQPLKSHRSEADVTPARPTMSAQPACTASLRERYAVRAQFRSGSDATPQAGMTWSGEAMSGGRTEPASFRHFGRNAQPGAIARTAGPCRERAGSEQALSRPTSRCTSCSSPATRSSRSRLRSGG